MKQAPMLLKVEDGASLAAVYQTCVEETGYRAGAVNTISGPHASLSVFRSDIMLFLVATSTS